MDPADIDLIVVNHIEPDHNSGLRAVMDAIPGARVVASRGGAAGIAEYHDGLQVDVVGAADILDLGGKTLQFMPAPMVHWPDSMFTYVAESKTLMPNDAFGQHVASSARFADELGYDFALDELGEYYANIIWPVGKQASKMVDKIVETGWELDVVAPSHGVIWRGEGIGKAIDAYTRMASGETRDKVLVVFTTMWESTRQLADAAADGAAAEGSEVIVFDLAESLISNITHEMLDARAVLFGSPTLHHGMLYRMAGYLQYLSGLKPGGKLAGTFGSYGWSSGACKQMAGQLEAIGFEQPFESFAIKYRPSAEEIQAAREWGAQFARAIKER
jgi:flavorubredoxin